MIYTPNVRERFMLLQYSTSTILYQDPNIYIALKTFKAGNRSEWVTIDEESQSCGMSKLKTIT